MKRNLTHTPNTALLAFLKANRRKMTSSEIAAGIRKNFRVKCTTQQVSKILSYLKETDRVSCDTNTNVTKTNRPGRPSYRWSFKRA